MKQQKKHEDRKAAWACWRWAGILPLAWALAACQSVRTTGAGQVGVTRNQYMMVSSEEVEAESAKAYRELLLKAKQKNQLNQDPEMLTRVRAVAQRLVPQVAHFRPDAVQWRWETNVFQSDQVNAFCMAGGKIGVYSGIIEKLKMTDDELAAVMGHEIAHALREHVREQMSMSKAAQIPGMLLGIFFGSIWEDVGHAALAVTTTLPRSREAETEADEIGVELAARAGYDPRAAVTLWEKMAKLSSGGRSSEFFSTHPSNETRISDLSAVSEKVLPLYQQARQQAQNASPVSSASGGKPQQ